MKHKRIKFKKWWAVGRETSSCTVCVQNPYSTIYNSIKIHEMPSNKTHKTYAANYKIVM